jgi:hypothetical protein
LVAILVTGLSSALRYPTQKESEVRSIIRHKYLRYKTSTGWTPEAWYLGEQIMTIKQPDQSSFTKTLISLFTAAQLVACGGGGVDNLSGVVPSEVVPGEVVPSRVTIVWTAPVARADESPLSLSEIGGYRVYYGTSEGDYPNRIDVNDGSAVEVTLNDLPLGSYYFVVTTYDVAGRESEFSPVLIKTI